MTLLYALLGTVLMQALPQDPNGEIERLRKVNRDLQERLDVLRRARVEDARTAKRLRQINKALKEDLAKAKKSPPPTLRQPAPPDAPEQPLKGKVVFVDSKMGFVMIDQGQREGVKPGYRFEINRIERENPDAKPRTLKIATAIFEKWMGDQQSMSKLKIQEGKASDIELDDEAVAIRKLVKIDPNPVEPGAPPPGKQGIYRITGRAGDRAKAGYIINYGKQDGAVQTAIVYAYKDGALRAKLRLDTVTDAFSVGNVIKGTLVSKPILNDQVYVQPLNQKQLTGKIVMVDAKRERVALDVRRREGAKVGQRYEVRRRGRKLGIIVLSDVQDWGAWADAVEGTSVEDLKKGDFAELLPE